VVIAPRMAPWLGRQSISITELNKQTIVSREPGSAARAAHDRLLAKGKISPARVVQFASREGVVNAVAEGIGIGTIFDEGVLPGDRVIKLRIAGPAVHSKVEIVCLADRKANKLIASFLGIARAMLGREFVDCGRRVGCTGSLQAAPGAAHGDEGGDKHFWRSFHPR
jgi:DNA-binding transcriptional LysR family regulator